MTSPRARIVLHSPCTQNQWKPPWRAENKCIVRAVTAISWVPGINKVFKWEFPSFLDSQVLNQSWSYNIGWSLLKLMSIESVIPSNHLIFCPPLLLPQSFSASGSFLVSWLFASGGQSIGASASVLPKNIQDWFSSGLTGLISLQSRGLSKVFSNSTVQSINSSGLSLLYGPTLISIHDYWERALC